MCKNSTFIDPEKLEGLLATHASPDRSQAMEVLERALEKKGLMPEDVAILLNAADPEITERLFAYAGRVKQEIYGRRLVLFAPLYIANYCDNNCLYCGFRRDNTGMHRRALTMAEIAEETRCLEAQGHKRILLLTGEDKTHSSLDYCLQAIETIYKTSTSDGKGAIRRINVEIAPLDESEFRRLKATDIGTYVLFQETYHPPTYAAMHPIGPKSDYTWRLYAMDRAQAAGIDDVGIGVLFGLHDYRFETLALLEHARHLEEVCGVGPHTISVPRLEPAMAAPASEQPPAPVSDYDFQRLVAILRLAVPYTGIILTTRETAALRNRLFALGVSQISAGSRTNPGGYGADAEDNPALAQQFSLGDTRSLEEVIMAVCEAGYLPSFCTACYRQGRTGRDFMDLAKPGLINEFCLPNAIMTFAEYLLDYAGPTTRTAGEQLIQTQLAEIKNADRRRETQNRLDTLYAGTRDVYF